MNNHIVRVQIIKVNTLHWYGTYSRYGTSLGRSLDVIKNSRGNYDLIDTLFNREMLSHPTRDINGLVTGGYWIDRSHCVEVIISNKDAITLLKR
jgi:hypothetical protein